MSSNLFGPGSRSVTPDGRRYAVLYAPGSTLIGSATTERGAIQCAGRISKLDCERWTATLAERLDGTLAWFVGPQLITR